MEVKKNSKVLILKGGTSEESKVSEASAKSCGNALRQRSLLVQEMAIDNSNIADLAHKIRTSNPDIVFNALHGGIGENGAIQGLLETLKVPYTHSGVEASSIAMNKWISKKVFRSQNLPVTEDILLKANTFLKSIPMKPPFVMKPNNGGSSVGIYFIKVDNDFKNILEKLDRDTDYLIEKYLPGRELSVSVLNNQPLTVTDIITDNWYNYDAKYSFGGSIHKLPAAIPSKVFDFCMDCALKAHQSLGCRGVSRTDFRWDEEKGVKGLNILEINTQPGMTETSLVPEQASFKGIDLSELCVALIKDASCQK
jgi:D-alanine-D-alanine ligase